VHIFHWPHWRVCNQQIRFQYYNTYNLILHIIYDKNSV
jgi:hypothetical protein